MAKHAQLPDGTVLEFPDETPDAVMDRAVKSHLQANPANDSAFAQMITRPQATSRAELERRQAAEEYAPTNGMPWAQRFAAGFGQSFVNTGEGLKQLATERIRDLSRGDFFGLIPADKGPHNAVTDWANRKLAEQQAAIDERRRLDAPLNATGAGTVGNISGNLTQVLLPGAALRGTTAGRALLPVTVRGNILQSAVLGGLQPTATGESRIGNEAMSAAVGGVLPVAVKLPGAIKRVAAQALRPEQAAMKEAARTIQREAAAPNIGMVANPSRVPDALTPRTLFEETLDPGVARLETRSRGVGPGWADRDSAANAERMAALRGIAGDEADMAAAEATRANVTGELRNQAFAEGDEAAAQAAKAGFSLAPNKESLKAAFQGIASEQGGRSAVQRTVNDVIADLDEAAPTVRGLYNVRKTIGDMLEGKAGSDKAYAKAATSELMQMRDLLDEEIANIAPSFEQYRSAFQNMSKPINRMQVGQELLARGTSGVDPVTGELRLMPGQYGRATKDLDALAQSATGFKKSQAGNILRSEDAATMAAVGDDLARQAARLVRGAGGGSHTASQLALGKRIAVGSLARAVPGVGAAVEYLEAQNAKRLEKALERILQNPGEYRAIAQLVSKEDRRLLEGALTQIVGVGRAGLVPAATNRRTPDVPVEAPALAK